MQLFIFETIFVVFLPISLMILSPQVYVFRHLIGIAILAYFFLMRRHFSLPPLVTQLTIPPLKHWIETAVITLILSLSLIIINHYYPESIRQMVQSLFSNDKRLLVLISYTLLSVPLQEIIFRWLYLRRLQLLRLHPAFPIIWSSIVFSSVHFPFHSPLMIIGTFILGLWWSYSTIKQQSIIPVSISHAVLGALILLLALF